MTQRRRAYTVGIVISLLIVALYFGIRLLDASCVSVFAHADPPATTRAEVALLMSEVRTLYDQQKYNSSRDAPLPMPVKVNVSGRLASLWISGPVYAGDFRYAQLWHEIYSRYHSGSPCVHLRLIWKNGGIVQHFPPDDM